MKLHYRTDNGEVYYAVWSRDEYMFTHTTNIPLSTFDIDEMSGNEIICLDLVKTQGKSNSARQRKYYILNNELYSVDGWIEFRPF